MRYFTAVLMSLSFQFSAHATLEATVPDSKVRSEQTDVLVADVSGRGPGYGGYGDSYRCTAYTECPNGRILRCSAHTQYEGNRECKAFHLTSVSCADENSTVYATCDQYGWN
jgi:hypothetical protein